MSKIFRLSFVYKTKNTSTQIIVPNKIFFYRAYYLSFHTVKLIISTYFYPIGITSKIIFHFNNIIFFTICKYIFIILSVMSIIICLMPVLNIFF